MIRISRNVTENKNANFIMVFYKHMVCPVLILLVTFGKRCNRAGKKGKWPIKMIMASNTSF